MHRIFKTNKFKLLLVIFIFGFLGQFAFFKKTRLGLDLKGGVSILLEVYNESLEKLNDEELKKIGTVLDKRINMLGVTEPVIQNVGTKNILIEIPAVEKTEEALSMLGKTSLLELKLRNTDGSLGKTIITGNEINKAELINKKGKNEVLIVPSDDLVGKIKQMKGKKLAVILNGVQCCEDVILRVEQQASKNSNVRIILTSKNGLEELVAKKLSILFDTAAPILNLESKAINSIIKVGEIRTIGSNLGNELIASSIKAGVVAVGLISIFMTVLYRLPGLISILALIIFAIVSFGVLNLINATLTLPGIAGFVLSMGMAVDANIITFEMIREEIKKGLSVKEAVLKGYARAITAISDANITTLLSTFALFVFGTGPIRGFAVTLSFGIVISLFTSMFVSKVFLTGVINIFSIEKASLFRVKREKGLKFTEFNFVKWFKFSYLFSGLMFIFLIVTMFVKDFDKGIDFTGGNLIQIKFAQKVNIAELNKEVDRFNNEVSNIRSKIAVADDLSEKIDDNYCKTIIIRTCDMGRDVKTKLYNYLREKFGEFSIEREDVVEPTVGNEIKWNAIKSISLAAILIAAYLAYRFEAKFAAGAIVAVLHDVLISIGVIALFSYEINSSFIVGILTILGYSTNNSVILFDRIRSNSNKIKVSSLKDVSELINLSSNQVLTRTINTSMTVLFSVLTMLMFGATELKTLLITFLVGIVSGTYSTVFVASPVVYLFDKFSHRKN